MDPYKELCYGSAAAAAAGDGFFPEGPQGGLNSPRGCRVDSTFISYEEKMIPVPGV